MNYLTTLQFWSLNIIRNEKKMGCGISCRIFRRIWCSSILFKTTRNGYFVFNYSFLVKIFLSFGVPVSRILGWVDAYRYLMMDEAEFDRKYNSQNFRDRYGNRRQSPQKSSSRYIVIEDETNNQRPKNQAITTKGRKESHLSLQV